MHAKIEGSTCGSKVLVIALLPVTKVNAVLYSSVIWEVYQEFALPFLEKGPLPRNRAGEEVYIVLMLLSRASCNPHYTEADEVSKKDVYATAFCA